MNRAIGVLLLCGVGLSISQVAAARGSETIGPATSKGRLSERASRAVSCHAKPRREWPRYTAIDLGAERPGSVGWAVNDFGVVAGSSPGVSEQPQATLWLGQEVVDLGTLGGEYSEALGLNNRGQVVGSTGTAEGGAVPFIWSDGEMRAIPGITAGQASGINDRGEVVGIAYEGEWIRAFIYDGEELRYLSSSNTYVTAFSINNRGQVVGSIAVGPGRYHGYVWKDGVFTDLESLGGDYDTAIDINDRGVVVGRSFDGISDHATSWVGSTASSLGVNEFFGGGGSFAWSINNRGEIVGESDTANVRAFYYRAGNVIDLNTITRAPSLPNNYALAINQWGAIAGAAYEPGGDGAHTTVWFPWW